MSSEANLASVRRGFELFNSGDLETMFEEVLHPEIYYDGEPNISVLTGIPVQLTGVKEVSVAWESFFSMFDEVSMTEIELRAEEGDRVLGTSRIQMRGGASQVPIDDSFHFAWVLDDGRWRFMAAKLDPDEVTRALEAWRG
jgi:hypothetical protein